MCRHNWKHALCKEMKCFITLLDGCQPSMSKTLRICAKHFTINYLEKLVYLRRCVKSVLTRNCVCWTMVHNPCFFLFRNHWCMVWQSVCNTKTITMTPQSVILGFFYLTLCASAQKFLAPTERHELSFIPNYMRRCAKVLIVLLGHAHVRVIWE